MWLNRSIVTINVTFQLLEMYIDINYLVGYLGSK